MTVTATSTNSLDVLGVALGAYAGCTQAQPGGAPASPEEMTRMGLSLFHSIRVLDETWSDLVRDGRLPYDREIAKHFQRLYTHWYRISGPLLATIESAGTRALTAEELVAFRAACREAKVDAEIDLEKLWRAEQQLSEGKTISMAEVRNELRRRMMDEQKLLIERVMTLYG